VPWDFFFQGDRPIATATRQKSTELNLRRLVFVHEYLIDGNATRAATAAGFSEGSAAVTGHRLLEDPIVKAEIAKRQGELLDKYKITQERVLEEVAAIAFSDISEIIEDTTDDEAVPRIRPVSRWSPFARRAINKVRVKRYVPKQDKGKDAEDQEPYDIMEFGLWDKNSALEKLMKRLDLAPDTSDELSDQEAVERVTTILERALARRRAKKSKVA
jgi:phage terminase small subunit